MVGILDCKSKVMIFVPDPLRLIRVYSTKLGNLNRKQLYIGKVEWVRSTAMIQTANSCQTIVDVRTPFPRTFLLYCMMRVPHGYSFPWNAHYKSAVPGFIWTESSSNHLTSEDWSRWPFPVYHFSVNLFSNLIIHRDRILTSFCCWTISYTLAPSHVILFSTTLMTMNAISLVTCDIPNSLQMPLA